MYQLTNNPNVILRIADMSWIPNDPQNTDYKKYLKWLAKGNIPLPAEEVGVE